MSPLPVLAGLGLALCLAFSLAAHALRDFSRSRLAELCQRRGRPGRFGEILRRHQTAFLAADALGLAALVLFLATAASWLGLSGRFAGDARTAGVAAAWAAALVGTGMLCRLILPWTLARVVGEAYLCRTWPLLRLAEWTLTPLVWTVRRLDRLTHRLAGLPDPATGGAASISEEIRSVVDEGQREGVIEFEAGTMIQRVIELQDEDIGSVMTPRTDMVTLRSDATIEEARKKFIEVGHSRVPVVGESVDDILGIVYAKDLLSRLDGEGRTGGDGRRDESIRDLVREPLYVPITSGVDTLLERMKRERVHLAIVVDEYGGVAGLVTLEDVIEEIVGDIVDEYDPAEETGIAKLPNDAVEAEGWVHIDDLNEQFDLDLPEDGDYDTLGGFVFNQLGRVPEIGEQFDWTRLRLTVTGADRRKVTKVRIEVLSPEPATERA